MWVVGGVLWGAVVLKDVWVGVEVADLGCGRWLGGIGSNKDRQVLVWEWVVEGEEVVEVSEWE